jgi:hypothetical protein
MVSKPYANPLPLLHVSEFLCQFPAEKLLVVYRRRHQETLAFSGIIWPLGDAGSYRALVE